MMMKKIFMSLSKIIKAIERARGVILILLMAMFTAVMYYLEKLYIGAPVLEHYAPHLLVGGAVFLSGLGWTAIIGKMKNVIWSFGGGIVVLMFMVVSIHAVHFLPLFLDLDIGRAAYLSVLVLGIIYIPVVVCLSLYVFFNYCCSFGKYVERCLSD